MSQIKNLRRSTNEKIIAGVCAGVARWLGWKPVTVRILFVVGSVLPIIPGFLAYIILWAIIPEERQHSP